MAETVIVYDRTSTGETGIEYYVPRTLLQTLVVVQGMTPTAALTQIAQQNLPTDATNLVFTSSDQLPTLWQVQNRKVADLRRICEATIIGGFVSSALGSAFTYPSTLVDQANMQASIIASLLPEASAVGWTTPFNVMDSNGIWAWHDHTQAQIQQAGRDGKSWITTQRAHLKDLAAQVFAATTIAQVRAITY